MKNHCKNNKTNLFNKILRGYFENNYQQFMSQKVMGYRKNTLIPMLGITLKAESLKLKAKRPEIFAVNWKRIRNA